jgi:hypothetical protein
MQSHNNFIGVIFMKKLLISFSMLAIVICILMIIGCDESTKCPVCPASNGPVYWVSVTVTNPQGQPQGGAIVSLANPPGVTGTFVDTTDNNGIGIIQAPAGQQQVIVTMGTVMQGTININVTASTTTSQTNPQTIGTVTLTQNTTNKKILVVKASAEQLEAVLRVIGYTTFDSTTINTLRDQAKSDSTTLLNYLKGYSIVFSDCDGSSEGGSEFAALSRTYGRYLAQGGKMYGGHYNYYHMQRIFPPYYQMSTSGYVDTLKIVNSSLSSALGYTVMRWSTVYHSLSYYDFWSDLPIGNSTVYSVMSSSTGSASSPQGIPIIVENRVGTGKYVWTAYHNQDIKDDPQLIKIVQYFLLSM